MLASTCSSVVVDSVMFYRCVSSLAPRAPPQSLGLSPTVQPRRVARGSVRPDIRASNRRAFNCGAEQPRITPTLSRAPTLAELLERRADLVFFWDITNFIKSL